MTHATTKTTAAGSTNPYETAGRSAKVLRLTISLDAALDMMGIDPFSARALEFVLSSTDAAWKCASSHAQVPMPSALTKRDVEDVYRKRIEVRAALQHIGALKSAGSR